LAPFVRRCARQEPCAHAATYVSGLLSDLESKNVESIAYRFGQERLALQRFGVGPSGRRALRGELAADRLEPRRSRARAGVRSVGLSPIGAVGGASMVRSAGQDRQSCQVA
jgi:hypothetical protein